MNLLKISVSTFFFIFLAFDLNAGDPGTESESINGGNCFGISCFELKKSKLKQNGFRQSEKCKGPEMTSSKLCFSSFTRGNKDKFTISYEGNDVLPCKMSIMIKKRLKKDALTSVEEILKSIDPKLKLKSNSNSKKDNLYLNRDLSMDNFKDEVALAENSSGKFSDFEYRKKLYGFFPVFFRGYKKRGGDEVFVEMEYNFCTNSLDISAD
jgi:hypothetical protein